MGYNADAWKARIAQRSDMTTGLIHLTRDHCKTSALDILLKILTERKLVGSSTDTGFIVGNRRAVCFQEAPIYSLAQNVYTEQEYRKQNKTAKKRYGGFGLQFYKPFVYKKGGRPVIYDQTKVAKEYLPDNQWWRIVNFDLSSDDTIIDWSHEREWRVPGDLNFKLSDVAVILPNHQSYKKFIEKCHEKHEEKILSSVNGIVHLGMVFF